MRLFKNQDITQFEESKTCNNVYKEKYAFRRIYRETDNDPWYEDASTLWTCDREVNHGGDHAGTSNKWGTYQRMFWPKSNDIDPRTQI